MDMEDLKTYFVKDLSYEGYMLAIPYTRITVAELQLFHNPILDGDLQCVLVPIIKNERMVQMLVEIENGTLNKRLGR